MKAKRPDGKLIEGIKNLLSLDKEALQFTRITEKFDVVKRSTYKGWVLRPDIE
jgi:hypothetical protein